MKRTRSRQSLPPKTPEIETETTQGPSRPKRAKSAKDAAAEAKMTKLCEDVYSGKTESKKKVTDYFPVERPKKKDASVAIGIGGKRITHAEFAALQAEPSPEKRRKSSDEKESHSDTQDSKSSGKQKSVGSKPKGLSATAKEKAKSPTSASSSPKEKATCVSPKPDTSSGDATKSGSPNKLLEISQSTPSEEMKDTNDVTLEGDDVMDDYGEAETSSTGSKKRRRRYKRTPCYSRKVEKKRQQTMEYQAEYREKNRDELRVKSKARNQKKKEAPLAEEEAVPRLSRKTEVGTLSLRDKERLDYKKPELFAAAQEAGTSRVEAAESAVGKKWRLKEKKRLEVALRSHNPDDLDAICHYIPSKTNEEVSQYIDYLARKPTENKERVPDFVAPIDNWTTLCDDLARGMTNHAEIISSLMRLCGQQLPERTEPGASAKPDYAKIYAYLADVLDRKPPPTLEPYEAVVVVDLLQTLASTINRADVTSQTDVMSEKYKLLTSVDPMDPTSGREMTRKALGMDCFLPLSDPRVWEPVNDSVFKTYDYDQNSFSWPQSLIKMPKFSRGSGTKKNRKNLEERIKVYTNQMQSFALNPFGIPTSILKLKKAK